MEYKLRQAQYSRVYRVSERTVRTWQEKGYPLDDPDELFQVLHKQKNVPKSFSGTGGTDFAVHLEAEGDPEVMREVVQCELAHRIMEGSTKLRNARDLARKYWTEWPEIVSRINAIVDHVEPLYRLLGIPDDDDGFDWDEDLRPAFLAREGLIHMWGDDPERKKGEAKRLVWADAEPKSQKRQR